MVSKPYRNATLDEALKSKKAARNYFYLDDKLYKKLRISNGHNRMVAFCYDDMAEVELPLDYALRKRRPTYSVTQAAVMLNRNRMVVNRAFFYESIPKPKKSFDYTKPAAEQRGTYRLSEKDVFRLRDYFASTRSLKNGETTSSLRPVPSRPQLANMMKYEKITYVRTSDGKFVPTWNAPNVDDWL